ncbi:hypothetical protein ACP275_03G043100 [Erythranthe tilingii]
MNPAHVIIAVSAIAVLTILRRNHRRRISSKDFINELPDDILISIITRMRTKDSTRMSILSKRWRNFYKFLPDIEFRCRDLIDCSSKAAQDDSNLMVEAVDRFFSLRSENSKIRYFSFCCCGLSKSHAHHFERWICSLGKLGVEELVLDFRCFTHTSDLPFSFSLVYEMPSLKSLKLDLCYLQPHMEKTQCNSLQIVILHNVFVLAGGLECILSTCLSLHTLSIDSCYFRPKSKLSVSGQNLQLKSLYILDCTCIESIRFCASNLMTFEFKSPITVDFIFEHVPQLQSIFLFVYNIDILPYIFGKLGQDLPQLKSLAFAVAPVLKNMCKGPIESNLFSKLKQLDFRFYKYTGVDLISVIPFLQSCPLLQEFHLDTSSMIYTGPSVKKPAIVVHHSELKKVELSGFLGTQNELEFALYVLKSAVGLDLMHINTCRKVYGGFGSWVYVDKTPWSRQTYKTIHRQLRGQALSKTARLVIQHESLHDEDKWGRSGGYYDIKTLQTNFKLVFN